MRWDIPIWRFSIGCLRALWEKHQPNSEINNKNRNGENGENRSLHFFIAAERGVLLEKYTNKKG